MSHNIRKKLLAAALSLAVTVSFLPALTLPASAIASPPVVTSSSGDTTFTQTDSAPMPVVVDASIAISASYDTLASATVWVSSNYKSSEDVLSFTNYDRDIFGNITASSYSNGVLTLTSLGETASVGKWRAALRVITYMNTSNNPSAETRTISFKVNDGMNDSNTSTKSISMRVKPAVTTADVNVFTYSTAVVGGNVTSDGGSAITDRGVYCSSGSFSPGDTGQGITKVGIGAGSGSFSSAYSLSPGTLYYVCAYAVNSIGASYGSVKSFTTTSLDVTTSDAANIKTNSAELGGSVISNGVSVITDRGVYCSSSSFSPGDTGQGITKLSIGTGSGSFSSSYSLSPGTTYYFCAYAADNTGTSYGSVKSFKTSVLPAPEITSISPLSGTTNGGTDVTINGTNFIGVTGVNFIYTSPFTFFKSF